MPRTYAPIRAFPRVCLRGLAALVAAALLPLGVALAAGEAEVAPTNDLPNPYRTQAPWGQLPGGRAWGALSAVAIDNDGSSVWVADRCGANPDIPAGASAFQFDSCAGSLEAPIHLFDGAGRLLRSFGAGMFIFPHKIYQDRQGNVWVVDNRGLNERERKLHPGDTGKGHAVYKFSPEGRLLLTIGTPGVAGNPPQALNQPNAIVEAPNGELYIAEGHDGQQPGVPPDTVARISRYSPEGRFISSFGRLGSGPGEFKTPHDLVIDGQGRLLVADRGNMRIQFLDLEGRYLGEWKQFSRPSGIALQAGMIYVADSESNGNFAHPGWERGIRVGSYADGKVLFRIPDFANLRGTSAAEGIAVDAAGHIYGAEVGPRQLVRHSR